MRAFAHELTLTKTRHSRLRAAPYQLKKFHAQHGSVKTGGDPLFRLGLRLSDRSNSCRRVCGIFQSLFYLYSRAILASSNSMGDCAGCRRYPHGSVARRVRDRLSNCWRNNHRCCRYILCLDLPIVSQIAERPYGLLGNYMKVVVGTITILIGLAAMSPHAHALTCTEQARICIQKGGSKSGCNASIARCKRTCIFVGTDGRSWPSSGDCKS